MKRICAAIAMTFERKKAREKIVAELDLVAQQIAKIFVHAPSAWDEQWEEDIAALFPRIIQYSNNIKSKSKKLTMQEVMEMLDDCWGLAAADTGKFWRSEKFEALKKSGEQEQVSALAETELLANLDAVTQSLARMILTSGTPEKLARIISSKTLTTREKLRAPPKDDA